MTSMHEAAAAWLISKFMMDAFFAKQQSLTLINVILGPSIVGKNMEFKLQVFIPIIYHITLLVSHSEYSRDNPFLLTMVSY